MTHSVILDNEAVQALLSVRHAKHRKVLALLQVVVARKRRHVDIDVIVPTAVRVEAGWDRSRPGAALINRLRIADVSLDGAQADAAASIAAELGVSVADAHVGATMRSISAGGDVRVVTSDPRDMARIASGTDQSIVVVRI